MHAYDVDAAAFVPFPVNAHRNAAANPNAQYRMVVKPETVLKSARIANPIALLDSSTPADGAATVIVAAEHVARELGGAPIRIAGSSVATGSHALGSRSELLWLPSVERSTEAVLRQARIAHADVDLLELSDQHGIVAALLLESGGFVERGQATRRAADGAIARDGALPLATRGGCKARGDALGALGVYQAVELVQQLRGDAGANQVANARIAFAQCLGGLGSTAATHVLVRED
jgi:acetyl-CoA C-acetyltransferase